jgi:hypothetical protein
MPEAVLSHIYKSCVSVLELLREFFNAISETTGATRTVAVNDDINNLEERPEIHSIPGVFEVEIHGMFPSAAEVLP